MMDPKDVQMTPKEIIDELHICFIERNTSKILSSWVAIFQIEEFAREVWEASRDFNYDSIGRTEKKYNSFDDWYNQIFE